MINLRRKPLVRTCAFPNCDKIVVARVMYCHEHYKRVKQGVLALLQKQRQKEAGK